MKCPQLNLLNPPPLKKKFLGTARQLFIPDLLLRTLRFPEIKTCETTDELRQVIREPTDFTHFSPILKSTATTVRLATSDDRRQLVLVSEWLIEDEPATAHTTKRGLVLAVDSASASKLAQTVTLQEYISLECGSTLDDDANRPQMFLVSLSPSRNIS